MADTVRRSLAASRPLQSHVRFQPHIEDDDDSSEDDELDRLRHEEALDQALADRYGDEAEEASQKKRVQSADEIAAAYDKQPRKRQKRPELTLAALTGVDGLIRLPTDLAKIRLARNQPKVVASADYALAIVEAYKSFCYHLMPSMAFEDVLHKIEKLGSKKELKAYLSNMRNDVRNRHVERLYGREKAEKMLQELEIGLRQQADAEEYGGDEEALGETAAQATAGDGAVAGPEANEPAALQTEPSAAAPDAVTARQGAQPPQHDDDDEEEMLSAMALPTAALRRRILDDDSSDEEEAAFDDVEQAPKATAEQDMDDEEFADARQDLEVGSPAQMPSKTVARDSDSEDEEEADFDDIQGADKTANKPMARSFSQTSSDQASPFKTPAKTVQDEEEEEEADFDDIQGADKTADKPMTRPASPLSQTSSDEDSPVKEVLVPMAQTQGLSSQTQSSEPSSRLTSSPSETSTIVPTQSAPTQLESPMGSDDEDRKSRSEDTW